MQAADLEVVAPAGGERLRGADPRSLLAEVEQPQGLGEADTSGEPAGGAARLAPSLEGPLRARVGTALRAACRHRWGLRAVGRCGVAPSLAARHNGRKPARFPVSRGSMRRPEETP